MAKKKKSKTASRKGTTARKAKKSAKRAAKKRTAKKSPQPKAARRKVAARAAATRTRKPEEPKSRLASAAAYARGAAATVVAAIADRLPWPANENDPIALLKTDHRRFEKLLEEGEKSTERAAKRRRELLDTLESELTVHEAIEEKVLYPALEPHAEAREVVLESFEEHHVADAILKELKETRSDAEKWGAKFKVLKENITHHIAEEERVMFPVARGVLTREDLLALGARMRELKAELERS